MFRLSRLDLEGLEQRLLFVLGLLRLDNSSTPESELDPALLGDSADFRPHAPAEDVEDEDEAIDEALEAVEAIEAIL